MKSCSYCNQAGLQGRTDQLNSKQEYFSKSREKNSKAVQDTVKKMQHHYSAQVERPIHNHTTKARRLCVRFKLNLQCIDLKSHCEIMYRNPLKNVFFFFFTKIILIFIYSVNFPESNKQSQRHNQQNKDEPSSTNQNVANNELES